MNTNSLNLLDMHKILMLREEIDSKITDHNENLCLSCLKNGQNRKPTNVIT